MTLLNTIIGTETFLQGKYLSVGLSSSGSIGTRGAAPVGQITDVQSGYLRVGMVADTDGFGTGKAAMKDAVARGMAIEGFNIGYKTGGETHIHSNQELAGLKEIAGKSSTTATKTGVEANWKGATTEKLAVDQKITLTEDAKYLRFDITLTNGSSVTMNDLRYMRTVDPDMADGYATINKVVKQGDGGALVTASATSSSAPMFLYTTDSRAVVSTYGFVNENPYEAAVSIAQKVGTTTKTDTSMNINFDLGSLGAGASTKLVFYMGVTDDLTATIAEINAQDDGGVASPPPPPPVARPGNTAPDAKDDALAITSGETGTGNVLANDKDANGDALTATLKSGPAHGTVTLSADGSFVYKAAAGYAGVDSFTYAASDGKASSNATVSVTVKAPAVTNPGLPDSDLVQRAGTLDGSGSSSIKMTGIKGHNSFFFDLDAKSGSDQITNFERDDVLVTKGMLADGNGDGLINFSKNKLSLGSGDSVTIKGVSGLRYLGTDEAGLSVYANAAVKPKGAIEGTIGDDSLVGGPAAKKSVFFFDTGLDIDLGNDRIDDFDGNDLIVTTTALPTTKLDSSGSVALAGVSGNLGTIDLNGAVVGALEFDGSVTRSGVTYYVYSQEGSAVGLGDLNF